MEDHQEPQSARDGAVGPLSWRDHLAAAPAEFAAVVPGLMLCIFITGVAMVLQNWEEATFGHPYVEALVIAILLGIAIRSFWQPGDIWHAGISLSAKTLLEIAVVLLGASISLGAIVASGPALLSGIVVTVAAALAASYATSRALGLPRRVSILIACGNSICGNSAIAAVAPVIGADSDELASSIAFTAILRVVVGVRPAIRRAGGIDRLCRAAGLGRDGADQRRQCAARNPGQAGAGSDARAGR